MCFDFCLGRRFDEEDGGSAGSFSEDDVRQRFIKYVYMLLFLCLLFLTTIIIIVRQNDEYFLSFGPVIIYFAAGTFIVSSLAISCCPGLARTPPINYVILAIFVISAGFFLGFILLFHNIDVILQAAGITCAVFLGLTIFACQTKIDFTLCSGMVIVMLIVLIVMGITRIFVHDPILNTVYAALGVIVYSFIILMETQMIVGENRKLQLQPDEYVYAASMLLMSILQLFMFILQLLADDS